MNKIYLDHHSMSQPDAQVIAQMLPYFKDKWGSYLQPHDEGQKLFPDLLKAYASLRDIVGATEEDKLVFTSSRAEAVAHVYDHVYRQVVRDSGRQHLITLHGEDAPILMGLKKLESLGCHATYLNADQTGSVQVQEILDALNPRTALVTFTLAAGMTGVIQSLQGLREVLNTRGVLLHLDVTYALGKMNLNFEELDVDFMTFGGEVIHGPKASGLLIAKHSIKLTPFIAGGLEQNGLRGGSLDTPSFMGFVKACELMKAHQSEMNLEVARLRDLFEKKLKKECDDIAILFQTDHRLPNVSVVMFEKVHADALLYALNKRGAHASIGGNNFQKLSHLLDHMSYPSEYANTAISFCFSRGNTLEEVNRVVGILLDEVKRLRLMTQKLELPHEV